MKGVLKTLSGIVVILCAVSLFNRLVLSVSTGYVEEEEFHAARIAAASVIPFDPFLYVPSPVYRDRLTEIYTQETIRRFALFHPMKDGVTVDTEHIDTHLYGEFRDYDLIDLWKTYKDIIRTCDGQPDEELFKTYDAFCRKAGISPPQKKPGMCKQLIVFHDDYMRRLEKKKDILANAAFYMKKFSQTGSDIHVKNIINLLRDFDIDLELRYKKDQPLYYIHNTLIRNAVLFQGYAINYLNDNDSNKLKEMYDKTLKPVIETLVDK